MIPSVIEASKKTGQMRLEYSIGNAPGLIPLTTFKVITEVEALSILAGVKATVVAAGGIGGNEGSRGSVVGGSEEQIKKALSVVLQVHDEPGVKVSGKVEAKPNRLPKGM